MPLRGVIYAFRRVVDAFYFYPTCYVFKRIWEKYRANLAKNGCARCFSCLFGILRSTYEHFIDKPVLASLVRGHIMISVRVLFDFRKVFARVFGQNAVELGFGL